MYIPAALCICLAMEVGQMTELELFARLIQCEAGGEGDNGMRAVASVVMNRVRTRTGEYGRYNTIRDVIYQTGQFNCLCFI